MPGQPLPPPVAPPIPEPELRATFGWRPGTIRGLLSLLVLALLWTVALFSPEFERGRLPLIYVYLQYLLVLIIAYYFPPYGSIRRAARNDRRLIRLWPELVPWLMIAGSAGLAAWIYQSGKEFDLPQRASFTPPLVLLAGFLVGHAATWLVAGAAEGRLPTWLQDLQAWVALVAMVLMIVDMILHVFILKGLEAEQARSSRAFLDQWEALPPALIAFYFGARTETPRVSS
jgi:hypothetical protein